MDELAVKTNEFLSGLSGSALMARYKSAKLALQCDAELFAQVEDYRQLSANLRKSAYSVDNEKLLSHIYWKLMLNDGARAYFEAEKRLTSYLRDFFGGLEQSLANTLFEGWD